MNKRKLLACLMTIQLYPTHTPHFELIEIDKEYFSDPTINGELKYCVYNTN